MCATWLAQGGSFMFCGLWVAIVTDICGSLSWVRQCDVWGCGTDTSVCALGSGRCKSQSAVPTLHPDRF